MKRVAVLLLLVSVFLACGKEEWNQNQIGVGNPIGETDETEPAADDDGDAAGDSAPAQDASTDAQPVDARSDARDATAG